VLSFSLDVTKGEGVMIC